MSIDALRERLPDYAKDIAANLKALADDDKSLTDTQKWGCFLACAYAVGAPGVIGDIEDACKLPDKAKTAAKAAAAIMGMNNIYYRALHMMKNPEYATMPAKLRMSIIADPGVDKTDFELWSLAVSAVNGCGACLDSHDDVLRKHAVPAAAVLTALRIAAVVNAASRVVAAEAAAKTDGGKGGASESGGSPASPGEDEPGYPTSIPAPEGTPIPAG